MKNLVLFIGVSSLFGQQIDYIKQVNNKPAQDPRQYNYTARKPGGSLSSGACFFTLNPVPTGLITGGWVYIQNGSGTAEAIQVTVSGTTISGTCANSHSGAFTVQSATMGLTEILGAFPTGAAIKISSTITTHAPIVVSTGSFRISGNSSEELGIIRASDFNNAAILQATASGNLILQDLKVSGNDSTYAGATISCYNGGVLRGSNLQVTTGYYGILTDSCATTWFDKLVVMNGNVSGNKANTGIYIDCSYAPTKAENNVSITHSTITMYGSPQASYGIKALCVDGLSLQNVGISAATPFIFTPSGSKYIGNVTLDNISADNFTASGVVFAGTSSLFYSGIAITGGWINCEGAASSAGIDFGFNGGPINAENINISGTIISSCDYGFLYGNSTRISTSKPVTVSGVNLYGNGTSTGLGVAVNNASGTSYNLILNALNVANFARGFDIQTTLTGASITGNRFCNNGLAFGFFGAITGIVKDNGCVDSTVVTLASASTLALPINSKFNLTGGTGVTAITFAGPAAFKWDFTVGTSTTFTAGATIGNTITITKVGSILWDGTKAWIQGI